MRIAKRTNSGQAFVGFAVVLPRFAIQLVVNETGGNSSKDEHSCLLLNFNKNKSLPWEG